jgi:hypothetical protein
LPAVVYRIRPIYKLAGRALAAGPLSLSYFYLFDPSMEIISRACRIGRDAKPHSASHGTALAGEPQ